MESRIEESDHRGEIQIPTNGSPTQNDISRVCIILILISFVLIAIMLVMTQFEGTPSSNGEVNTSTVAGWVAVCGASIIFGGTGVPMKSPSLIDFKVDPFVFSLYTSIGIFIISFPLIIYLAVRNVFEFRFWAILGAADISLIGFLACMAVQRLGYCKAPAIWAGVGMICAFIWGIVAFNEEVSDIAMAIVAVLLLVGGVYCVSTSQASNTKPVDSEVYSDTMIVSQCESPVMLERNEEMFGIDFNESKESSTCINKQTFTSTDYVETNTQYDITREWLRKLFDAAGAYFLCFAVGFFDGTLLVPFKLSERNRPKSLHEVFCYLASFGISSLFVAPLMFLIYCVLVNKGKIPSFHIKAAIFPGVSSGILWASANFMSVHATYYLGIKIGFTLTQTCVLFAAMWGVFYFREIDLRKSGFILRFCLGISCILVGAYFMGASG